VQLLHHCLEITLHVDRSSVHACDATRDHAPPLPTVAVRRQIWRTIVGPCMAGDRRAGAAGGLRDEQESRSARLTGQRRYLGRPAYARRAGTCRVRRDDRELGGRRGPLRDCSGCDITAPLTGAEETWRRLAIASS
jgi:hypothetical protein